MSNFPKDVIGFSISSEILKEKSLTAIYNTAAEGMKKAGMPEGAILAARQQFFIGADAFYQIARIAQKENDTVFIEKLVKEIRENLVQKLDA